MMASGPRGAAFAIHPVVHHPDCYAPLVQSRVATLGLAFALVACTGDPAAPEDAAPPEDAATRPDASTSPLDSGGLDAGGLDSGERADAGPVVDPCAPVEGSFTTLSRSGPATDRPAAMHGDINLALRGFAPTGGVLGLIEVDGPTDANAPKLFTMFIDDRVPAFSTNYAVNQWDWGCNCRSVPIADWEVTLAGFQTTPGETIELADSGYDIGGGNDALVLYADDHSITFKYTREDNVVIGYTIHVDGVCVDPRLRELYDASDAGGRVELPALRGNQAFGRAIGAEVRVAIRDSGAFMDPRVRKDWW